MVRHPNLTLMATLTDRFPGNSPGIWYNDTSCIDCGLCPELAPGIFRRDAEFGQTLVWHQPATAEETALAVEAQALCPTDSIGSDGAPAAGP